MIYYTSLGVPQPNLEFTICSLMAYLVPGTLVVEKGPGWPPSTNHQSVARAEAPPGGLSMSAAQQRQSTLAQLQMQV